jgi:hypothetical protein
VPPSGKPAPKDIEVDEDLGERAHALLDRGDVVRFTIETLRTGEWSLAVEGDDEDLVLTVLPPGTTLPEAVRRFVIKAERYFGVA